MYLNVNKDYLDVFRWKKNKIDKIIGGIRNGWPKSSRNF